MGIIAAQSHFRGVLSSSLVWVGGWVCMSSSMTGQTRPCCRCLSYWEAPLHSWTRTLGSVSVSHCCRHTPGGVKVHAQRQRSSEARDVLAVPIKVVTVSKGGSAVTSMSNEWLEKLRRYTEVSEVQIKPNPKKSALVAVQMQAEGEKVLKAISPSDFVVVLDERGREVTSEGMARIVAAAGDRSASGLVFCIGGPFGHSEAVRAREDDCIRLSALVLNHQVAYVVLIEQLYRGWTILRGEPYHH